MYDTCWCECCRRHFMHVWVGTVWLAWQLVTWHVTRVQSWFMSVVSCFSCHVCFVTIYALLAVNGNMIVLCSRQCFNIILFVIVNFVVHTPGIHSLCCFAQVWFGESTLSVLLCFAAISNFTVLSTFIKALNWSAYVGFKITFDKI